MQNEVVVVGAGPTGLVLALWLTKMGVRVRIIDKTSGPGSAGAPGGDRRLPWARAPGLDNYDSLAAIAWQIHVYGAAREPLARWCAAHGVPMHVFPWTAPVEEAGFARDAAYLLRPDTYVALAEPSGDERAIERYLTARSIRLPGVA